MCNLLLSSAVCVKQNGKASFSSSFIFGFCFSAASTLRVAFACYVLPLLVAFENTANFGAQTNEASTSSIFFVHFLAVCVKLTFVRREMCLLLKYELFNHFLAR